MEPDWTSGGDGDDMTMQLVDGGWSKEFTEAVQADSSELRIVCPFIKASSLQRLLRHHPGRVQVITRFNLADFADGVSDVTALRRLLEGGARVRGVRNLHAKLYLFGESRAIITSCNLTEAALSQNRELGMVIQDWRIVKKCLAYFDKLWRLGGNDLLLEQVDAWDKTVTDHWLRGGRPHETGGLKDFGVDTGIEDVPFAKAPIAVADASQAFVKLLGTSKSRVPLSYPTIDEINRGGCHWAACYPANKRPTGVRDGAVIFMGRLSSDPNDIRVIGRAIGMAYRPVRDDATPADIELRPWREQWSRYIRVHNAEFVDGTIANGVSLNELMDALKDDSFASTQRNAARGEGNTNPRRAYIQQPAVELSPEGLSWLGDRLEAAFEAHGKVPRDSLEELDWPDSADSTPSPH